MMMARLVLCLLVLTAVNGKYGSSFQADDNEYGEDYQISKFNRSSFPRDFVFGTASSAYQVEGAWNVDGKGPSNWDVFTHTHPDRIEDHSNADVAADSYHLYKRDVELLKKMNMDAYRFSISWPRILPRGKISGGVNEKGIEYYNKLIDRLIYHDGCGEICRNNAFCHTFSLGAQALEDEYGGFLSHKIIEDFQNFANLCFEKFGDRVKYWTTINEAYVYTMSGYESGSFAPYRCSAWKGNNCTGGDSATEPYIVMHNLILSHAKIVELYRTKYQAQQNGKIGITVVTFWVVPYSKSDIHAAKRSLDFQLGWNLRPLVYGDYPKTMRSLVGDRLPRFTKEESDLVKGSFDFLGLNYYTAKYVKDTSHISNPHPTASTDSLAKLIAVRNGNLIGEQAGSSWLHYYPRGLRDLLMYVKHKYKQPIIYITENGVDDKNDPNVPLKTALKDYFRIKYFYKHLKYLHIAIRNGVKVRGYFGWALVDNFEWEHGYTVRFGLNYVDYKNKRKRYPKLSAKWFKSFLARPKIHQ